DARFYRDTFAENGSSKLQTVNPPPYRANIAYFAALDQNGAAIKTPSETLFSGGTTSMHYPFSDLEGAQIVYKNIEITLIENGYFPNPTDETFTEIIQTAPSLAS